MAFEKKAPQWHAAGTEPPESLKQSGFQAGYKPPAEFFNWQWHAVGEAIAELQGMKPGDIGALGRGDLEAHIKADNPHGITADKIGAAEARHTHAQGEVTGLSESLSGKADKVHTHGLSDVTGLDEALSAKADKSHTHAASDIKAGTLGGRVQANAAATAELDAAQLRSIRASTADLAAGTAALPSGEVYLVYE
jgi:hypothetical protein